MYDLFGSCDRNCGPQLRMLVVREARSRSLAARVWGDGRHLENQLDCS